MRIQNIQAHYTNDTHICAIWMKCSLTNFPFSVIYFSKNTSIKGGNGKVHSCRLCSRQLFTEKKYSSKFIDSVRTTLLTCSCVCSHWFGRKLKFNAVGKDATRRPVITNSGERKIILSVNKSCRRRARHRK